MAHQKKQFLSVEEAMQIVHDMATAYFETCDQSKMTLEELKQQREALNVVHDFAVNHLGDD